jgi:hypothetical protein
MRQSPMRLIGTILIASQFVGGVAARAEEIARPTPKMLADAREMVEYQFPNDKGGTQWEFHFRNLEGHVLWCAYATGGNGGFCKRLPPGYVARVDRAATEECASMGADDWLPHATYGELGALDYKCIGGHMSRLPVDYTLDREGYVRQQWTPLR